MVTTKTVGANSPGTAAANALPLKEECPDGQVGALKEQGKADTHDCTDTAAERKTAKDDTTLIASAAIAGFELVKLADGTWLAKRWGMSKPLADAQAVGQFLVRVGVQA